MGYTKGFVHPKVPGYRTPDGCAVLQAKSLPDFSQEIFEAMKIVEHVPYRFALIKERDGSNERRYKAFFSIDEIGFPVAYAETAAHAICLAALKTLDLGDFI